MNLCFLGLVANNSNAKDNDCDLRLNFWGKLFKGALYILIYSSFSIYNIVLMVNILQP